MKRLAVLVPIALCACATAPHARAEGSTAGFGETAAIDGIRVRPISLIEDSRCPTDVVCVWAGRLVIRAEIAGGNWRLVRDLTLGQPSPLADGELRLVTAEPAKRTPGGIAQQSYRFTFRFDGGL